MDAAENARRLAVAFSTEEDRSRILEFAAQLEADADALEQRLASAPPSRAIKQTQMQLQQQAAAKPGKPK